MALMPSPLLSLSSQPNSKAFTPSASPAVLPPSPPPDPSLSPSPFKELSPDILPLLPSPGGVVPNPTGSDIPIIPSNPSPPNPDDAFSPGPLSAFSPFGGSFQASSSSAPVARFYSGISFFAALAAYWV
ncbi:classical arabinogalactan protein 25 [Quillaja saponaria]|uniref:Classical arabinogalactan protein 25 n=1 Tax=Quillaja saponaria TaxID=32244 RepID=A0AAD7VLL8_QUISA|nr:classical arabinogalactan protein 25 [Quillaja saponaria]